MIGKWRPTTDEAYADVVRIRGGDRSLTGGWTLKDGCDQVLQEAKAKRTEGSVRWYREHFAVLQRDLGADRWLVDIGRDSLEEWVRDRLRAVKPATVNADLTALHRVFAVAIRRGMATVNPVRQVDRPRADRPAMDFFTPGELQKLLAKVDNQRARDLFVALSCTGLRRSELARITAAHVRRTARQVVVAGKNETRVLPLSDDAAPAIERLGLPIAAREIDETFREWRVRLGEPRLHAHALRHSFATALVRQGERPDVVMRLMGHRCLATTLRYWHEHGHEAERAVKRLRLVRARAARRASPRSAAPRAGG